jgi:hypothetical protein
VPVGNEDMGMCHMAVVALCAIIQWRAFQYSRCTLPQPAPRPHYTRHTLCAAQCTWAPQCEEHRDEAKRVGLCPPAAAP